MELIEMVLTYNIIISTALAGWFTAQVLKTIIESIMFGKIQISRMWGDGGMPSAHTATVCSLVVAAGRVEGMQSSIFAVACIVAFITMHDAMGVRRETGEQAKVLNNILQEWITISSKNNPFLENLHLKEMVGHTPLQVVGGAIIGVLVGFLAPISATIPV